MHKMKKMICMVLCFSMMFSCVQTVNAAETKEYDIYPIVRDIDYDGTEFTMANKVNVVYENGIDDATKNYLEEVLNENGVTSTAATTAKDGEWNILLGVNGSKGDADIYEDGLSLEIKDLYDQYDGYLLEAKDKQITIVGKDTDAVFRGVATLKMMLSSFGNRALVGAQIEDYAGIEFRGFIEGFYGGWDYPTRADLMEFAKDVKMNMYVYASKTDAYHTNMWNVLYPDSELRQIEELVKVGEETKCYYVWSVHLGSFFNGLNISANKALYEQRYNQLVAKFTQLYNVGVRKFDILNDDFGSGSHADVVTVLNRLNKEFIIPKGCKPITYCPQGYNKAWSGNGAELDALKALDDSIILYWTGDDVNSPITQSTVDYVGNRTGQPVSYWLNYPVNEHAKAGLFLGDITHYARDGVTGLKGAVSNPSRFGYSNKVGLFQLAALFWNNNNYSAYAEKVWLASFNYLEEGVEEAYRTIGRNVANCPGSSRVGAGFPESEYIKANLEAVAAAVNNGETIKNLKDTKILLDEFSNILDAIKTFRKDCKNEKLVSELDPWLKSLEGITIAAQGAINSIVALEEENLAGAWTNFAAASKGLKEWNAYPTCDDPSITQRALAGSKRIQPFASDMITYVEGTLTPIFDTNYSAQNLIAVLGGQKQSMDDNAQKMFDNDLNTSTQWNIVQQKDDYFGVDLGVVKKVTDINIVQGNTDSDHDIFHKAVLEYSEDGKTYTQLGERYNDAHVIALDNLDIQARYVRLRLEETGIPTKPDFWTHIREFTVNKEVPEGNRVYTNMEAYAKQPLTVCGKEYSLSDLENVTLEPGDYLGMKFVDLCKVSSVAFEGNGLEGLEVWASENGTQAWPVADETQILKYIWIENVIDHAITFDLNKLGVVVESAKANPKFLATNLTNGIKEGSWDNVFDGNDSTYVWTNEGQTTGDYITFDLGTVIDLYDLEVVTADGNPRFYNAEIQISTDNQNWDTIAKVENDNSKFEVPYRYVRANAEGKETRYIRIYITGDTGYYLKIQEIFLNKTVDAADETAEIAASFGEGIENAIDGNLSTIFSSKASAGDFIEYKFTESTNFNAISILQDPNSVSSSVPAELKVERLFGSGRYETGYAVADALKEALGVEKFEAAVVATGKNFADALAGSYLAVERHAPILLTNGKDDNIAELHAYIKENVAEGGKVYILGGEGAVPSGVDTIKGYDVVRLFGDSRYDTNLAILNEAGVKGDSIIVATGKNFADSLSASAAKLPILLVKPNAALNDAQKAILKGMKNIYIVGGDGAVSASYEAELKVFGEVTRVFGDSRYDTSVEIAKTFCGDVNTAVVASGKNFPDGLCGGPLAAALNAPLVLTKDGGAEAAAAYVAEEKVTTGYVLGGDGALTNETVDTIFVSDDEVVVEESKVIVKVLKDGGYEVIGYLDESAKKFELDPEEYIYALRIEFEEETDIAIYEIYLDAEDYLGDIGEYVDPIVKEPETPDPAGRPEASNLAPGKAVTVSGTSDGNKDNVNDGDESTKWDSDFIKGGNAKENAWVSIDLGSNKTSIFDATKISYFNKIYPTVMEIQISNDGENWVAIKKLTSEHSGPTNPIVTESFGSGYAARYVRLFFDELNSAAAGNGVGVKEWEITGISLSNMYVKSVQAVEGKEVNVNTSAKELGLPEFVSVTLTHASAGDYVVLVPVNWNTDNYNAASAGTYTVEGSLNLPKTVTNAETISATVVVK